MRRFRRSGRFKRGAAKGEFRKPDIAASVRIQSLNRHSPQVYNEVGRSSQEWHQRLGDSVWDPMALQTVLSPLPHQPLTWGFPTVWEFLASCAFSVVSLLLPLPRA